MDKNTSAPWSTNQIQQDKPAIPRSTNLLIGYIGGSTNGGHNRTIAFKQVMAGEKHKEYRIKMHIKMLTPLTPTYQNLKMTIRSYFVPNSRVWENAEKFTAQKGGTETLKIKEMPNLGGREIPILNNYDDDSDNEALLSNTSIWREMFISNYIPRIGQFSTDTATNIKENNTLPKLIGLPLRGRVAIYNDMERNKQFDTEYLEFKTDEITDVEWQTYTNPNESLNFMRCKKSNSYYTDYRADLQGFSEEMPDTSDNDTALLNWSDWESKIALARTQATNAEKNDWEIIAEMRGSKVALQGKVQLIGQKTFNLNYATITQNTYNTNEMIEEQFRVLGQQGAYSYTEVNVPCYAGVEFIEEGYVHIIATVQAETIYENGFDRLELNSNTLDRYNPDLKDEKNDVLYNIETSTQYHTANETSALGFKRKFSEYFKLPNLITGDMTTPNYFKVTDNTMVIHDEEIITQNTFQFFETDAFLFVNPTDGYTVGKNPWKDYTDLLINKNQAITNAIKEIAGDAVIDGQNQIFWVGKCECVADMPIDESIKNNFTKWGEH